MSVSRRELLTRSAATGLGLALVGSVDSLFGAGPAAAAAPGAAAGYGPLIPDPNHVLSLPSGFRYQVVSQAGATMLQTGQPSPDRPDGTASFPRRGGGSVLVQNHEISATATYPVPHLAGLVYDVGANGGTTTLEVGPDGNRVGERVSLAGTYNNCAGGRTPWQTWISCEETEVRADPATGLTMDHGYAFEVDPYDEELNRDPTPIKAFGRFPHEAAVVDPDTGRVYLTEDASAPNGLLYRFTPPDDALPLGKGSLRRLGDSDGRLEAMVAHSGGIVPDLSVATEIGTTYRVTWTAVPDRDARIVSTRKQFAYAGMLTGEGEAGRVTRSRKLEGMWWGDGGAYVVASFARFEDGSARQHDGQVWFLDPVARTLTLKLRFAYTASDQNHDPDGPDNITVSPYGGVILAEDGEGRQHLVGASAAGETFFLARNDLPSSEEFTGPNFSGDKTLLFANIQVPGYTFAISGPFARLG